MKKEAYRDYATAAIRAWAAAGRPSAEVCQKRFTGAVRADMEACALVFRELEAVSPEICRAAEAVYMADPAVPLKKGELTGRVLRFSMGEYVSERQVWEWLAKVRRAFAETRGLVV